MGKAMTEFRVGLFVSLGLGLAMMVIFMIGSQHKVFETYDTFYTNFDNISGLRVGAPVQLAGLKVGFVDDIHFPTELKEQQIVVEMNIVEKYKDRVRKDSVATIETQGLLGDKFIYITVGSEEETVVEDGGTIPSKSSTSVFALADKAGKMLDNIGDGDIKATLSSIRKTVEQVEKGQGLLHSLIYDPKGPKIIDDLSVTLRSAKDLVSEADKASIFSNLKTASADLKVVMESVKRGDGTIGKLINDPALYDDLRALLGRANRNNLLKAVIRSTMSKNDKQLLK